MRRDVLPRLDLRTTGMEFASEMVDPRRARRSSTSASSRSSTTRAAASRKLSSFRDGWRHLRFLLVHSPTHLFIAARAPLLALLGVARSRYGRCSQIDVFGREWDLHAMIAGALLMIVGAQVLALGLCAHAYGTYFMGEKDPWFDRMRARFRLEHGLLLGGAIVLAGVAGRAVIVVAVGRPRLRRALRGAARGARRDAVIVGVQIFFSSFLLSILGLRRRSAAE